MPAIVPSVGRAQGGFDSLGRGLDLNPQRKSTRLPGFKQLTQPCVTNVCGRKSAKSTC